MRVDLDGIASRVAPFPVAENRFGQLAGAAGRKVLWTRAEDRRRARPRRPQGSGRQARASSTSTPAAPRPWPTRSSASSSPHDGTTAGLRDGKRLRAIAAETARPASPSPARTTDDAVAQERLARPRAHARLGRAARASGGRCCARSGGCSATSSGSPDMSGVDWEASRALRAAGRRAWPRAASSPT